MLWQERLRVPVVSVPVHESRRLHPTRAFYPGQLYEPEARIQGSRAMVAARTAGCRA